MDEKRGLARDTLIFLPSKVVEGLIGIGTLSYISRVLTKGAANDFGAVNTIVVFSYLVMTGWLANAMNRYVGEQGEGSDFYPTGSAIFGATAALGWIAALVAAYITQSSLWIFAAVMLSASALYQLTLGMLVQTGRRRASVVLSLLSAVIKPAVVFIVCMLRPDSQNAALPAVLAYTFSELVAGIAAVIILGVPKSLGRGRFSAKTARLFFAYGVPLMGVSLSISLLNQADRLILIFSGVDFSTYYFNNSISASVFTMLMVGVMRAVYPSVLRAHREGGRAAAKPLLDAGVRMYLLVAMPAVAGIAALSGNLSRLLFVETYASGHLIMAFGAVAMFFSGLTEYANKTWELSGNTRPIMYNALASVLVKIALSFALLPVMGAQGVALSSVAGFALYFTLSCLGARKTLLFSVPFRTLLSITVASAACALAALGVCMAVGNLALSIVLAIAAGMVAYAATLLLTGEIKDEAAALAAFIRRKK